MCRIQILSFAIYLGENKKDQVNLYLQETFGVQFLMKKIGLKIVSGCKKESQYLAK